MPRPKGSKNNITLSQILAVQYLGEKIAAAEAEIEKLTVDLKTKKNELKDLLKAKEIAAKAAAEKKAEEDKAALLAAVENSGKTIEEILEFLNK